MREGKEKPAVEDGLQALKRAQKATAGASSAKRLKINRLDFYASLRPYSAIQTLRFLYISIQEIP